jgi:hypothetical protein
MKQTWPQNRETAAGNAQAKQESTQHGDDSRDERCPTGTNQPECGRSKVAENEHPVQEDIQSDAKIHHQRGYERLRYRLAKALRADENKRRDE